MRTPTSPFHLIRPFPHCHHCHDRYPGPRQLSEDFSSYSLCAHTHFSSGIFAAGVKPWFSLNHCCDNQQRQWVSAWSHPGPPSSNPIAAYRTLKSLSLQIFEKKIPARLGLQILYPLRQYMVLRTDISVRLRSARQLNVILQLPRRFFK